MKTITKLVLTSLITAILLTGWVLPGLGAQGDQKAETKLADWDAKGEPAVAEGKLKEELKAIKVGGRVQLFGEAEKVTDIYRKNSRVYGFMKMARMNFTGQVQMFKYRVELGFGPEEEIKAPSPGVSLNLLDMYFDVPLPFKNTNLRVGQFKIPYSRERLADPSYLQFSGRSIQNLAFQMGRDLGAAVFTDKGKLALGLGVFTGGGRDLPTRYLPENLGFPLVVVRAGINDGLDENIFTVRQTSELHPGTTKKAFYVNALYMRDSLVGHSTVLNVKLAEKSLLLNGNWNPFLGQKPFAKGEFWQVGTDAALQKPWRGMTISAEAEANYGSYSSQYGHLHVLGGRAQIGARRENWEPALRYAIVVPDANMAMFDATKGNSFPITGRKPFHELTPALTYHVSGDHLKLIMELPVMFRMPVATEKNIGAYVVTEQPDQVSVLASGGTVARQTVVAARVLLQLTF
ncbi:MAG: porin [Terriglobia bacterium]